MGLVAGAGLLTCALLLQHRPCRLLVCWLPGRPQMPAGVSLALGRANSFLQGSDFLLVLSRALGLHFLSTACHPLVSVDLISIDTRVANSKIAPSLFLLFPGSLRLLHLL